MLNFETQLDASDVIISGHCTKHNKHTRPTYFIGIDPDIHSSGFAVYMKYNKKLLECSCFTFFDLQRKIMEYDENFFAKGETYIVHIEGGWLVQKSNFHTHTKSPAARERIAKNVGSNHEAGRKIVEMCIEYEFPFIVRKPITPKFADERIFKMITRWEGRTNSDARSAANYVYGF